MYRCEITGKNSKVGEKLNKVICLTRPKEYFKYIKNDETRLWEKVFAATGFEPVRELSLSREGLDLWNSWGPEDKQAFLTKLGIKHA